LAIFTTISYTFSSKLKQIFWHPSAGNYFHKYKTKPLFRRLFNMIFSFQEVVENDNEDINNHKDALNVQEDVDNDQKDVCIDQKDIEND